MIGGVDKLVNSLVSAVHEWIDIEEQPEKQSA